MLFYLCDTMRAWVLALVLCPRLSQVSVLSKGMNGLICFLAWRLLSAGLMLCFKEIQVSTRKGYLPLEFFPELQTSNFATAYRLSNMLSP